MIKIELERQDAVTLAASLQRRLEVIQQIEDLYPEKLSPDLQTERSALVPAILVIEQALKSPRLVEHCGGWSGAFECRRGNNSEPSISLTRSASLKDS